VLYGSKTDVPHIMRVNLIIVRWKKQTKEIKRWPEKHVSSAEPFTGSRRASSTNGTGARNAALSTALIAEGRSLARVACFQGSALATPRSVGAPRAEDVPVCSDGWSPPNNGMQPTALRAATDAEAVR